MFEKTLLENFKKVFELKKASYDQPGASHEQDCLFIAIEKCDTSLRDGSVRMKVQGKASLFAEANKLPFGYFPKCIDAHASDVKDLFFYNLEENAPAYTSEGQNEAGLINIIQRSFSFIYFFNSQHDPDIGTLTSITTEVST